MKPLLLVALLGAIAAPALAQSTILASWNFETGTISGTGTDFGPISAATGSGGASGHHAASAATWSSPAGNGSTHSFSVNNWATGDYFQLQTSATGYTGLMLTWDQTGSSTGPKDFELQYSTDGSSWTNFASYAVLINGSPNVAWSSTGTPNATFSYSYDLSSVTALNNAATVYFRLTDLDTTSIGNATVASGGTDRLDNFVVTATAIPEPGAFAAAVGLAGLTLALRRKSRRVIVA
jgi:hypothetical protein